MGSRDKYIKYAVDKTVKGTIRKDNQVIYPFFGVWVSSTRVPSRRSILHNEFIYHLRSKYGLEKEEDVEMAWNQYSSKIKLKYKMI